MAVQIKLSGTPAISLITSELEHLGPSTVQRAGERERLSQSCRRYLEIVNMDFLKWRAGHFTIVERNLCHQGVPHNELQHVMDAYKTRFERLLPSTGPLKMLPSRMSPNLVVRDLILRKGLEPPPDYPMPNLPKEDSNEWKLAMYRGKARHNLGLTGISKANYSTVAGFIGDQNGWRKQDWVFRNYMRVNEAVISVRPSLPPVRDAGTPLATYLGVNRVEQINNSSSNCVPGPSRFGAIGDRRPQLLIAEGTNRDSLITA